jgi:hypothetical protein
VEFTAALRVFNFFQSIGRAIGAPLRARVE